MLHLLDTDRTLLRSLPNPLTPAPVARIPNARPAGPTPAPAAGPLRVDRRVSSRGSVCIARQKIQVGIGHAGQTVTVEEADTTFHVYHGEQLLTEVVRTTTDPIARFKARKPEPPRVRHHSAMAQRPVFTDPWWDLQSDDAEVLRQRNTIEAELAAELAVGHPLHGQELTAVAKSDSSDDIIVEIAPGRWARVHLTWKGTAETPPWPMATFYSNLSELERDLSMPN